MITISPEMQALGKIAKKAAKIMAMASTDTKAVLVSSIAKKIEQNSSAILAANEQDVASARIQGMSEALIDRLLLNEKSLVNIASDIRKVATLTDPIGQRYEEQKLPNGLRVCKRRVPIGVLAVIYEARPNVTIDVAALALKAGNSAILRGGSETLHTNKTLVAFIQECLHEASLPATAIQLITSTERYLVQELLAMDHYIDILIPRGGQALQQFCREHSRIPVITGGIGICHLYLDEEVTDLSRAVKVIYNAKVQRPTVCNALDTLLIHRNIAPKALPLILERLGAAGVSFRLDERSWDISRSYAVELMPPNKQASIEDWQTEWLSLILGIKIVDTLEEAIDHICQYSTRHSDGILTDNPEKATQFVHAVDTAAVYVNASTRFTDGAELGLGAEIAISTQKLHARGPMGLQELTSYQWLIEGDYHVRS